MDATLDASQRTALFVAAHGGHTEVMQLLLDAGADAELVDEEDNTPLIIAAAGGSCAALELLLSAGADVDIDAADSAGCTALVAAAAMGHLEAVRFLLDRGAAVNGSGTLRQQTPLMAACGDGHADIAELLLQASWAC